MNIVLSAKILEFHVRFLAAVPYVNDNYERLNLPFSIVELMNKNWENWEKEYKIYINPLQTISDVDAMYDTCFDFMSKLRIRLKGDPLIKLNSSDMAVLQINANKKTQGKIPVTDYAPVLACISQSHLLAKFFAFDPKHPNKKKKPEGAAMIGVKIAFTEPDAPAPKPEEYKNQPAEKKSIFELTYPADKAKKIMYIIVYYISPTGEASNKESSPLVIILI